MNREKEFARSLIDFIDNGLVFSCGKGGRGITM